MRNAVRKFVGVALVGLLGALALPMLPAGAQTEPGEGAPPTPECVIQSVVPMPVNSFPSVITVTVTVDAAVQLTLYAQAPPLIGPQTVLASQPAVPGSNSISGTLTEVSNISLGITYGNENAYAAACATVDGETVIRVNAKEAPANVFKPAAQLAFTGSSDTPSYVLIGIAALVVGAVLVVAARRRRSVS